MGELGLPLPASFGSCSTLRILGEINLAHFRGEPARKDGFFEQCVQIEAKAYIPVERETPFDMRI